MKAPIMRTLSREGCLPPEHSKVRGTRPSPGISARLMMMAMVMVAIFAAPFAAADVGPGCTLESSYGPFDYRKATKSERELVERFHFTSDIEMLKHGSSGSSIPGPDINYTLTVFPNHPRALKSMMDLGFREKKDRPQGVRFTIECYFDRAMRFTPDDETVKVLYAVYLQRSGKNAAALEVLSKVSAEAGENANIQYNLGLLYLELGRYDEALQHAHAAYRLGFTLPGLRNRLVRAGKWKDDTAGPAAAN